MYVKTGNKEVFCSNQKELMEALGLSKLPLHGKGSDPVVGDNYCLCPIDVRKAGEMAGYKVEYDMMNYYLTRQYGGRSSSG